MSDNSIENENDIEDRGPKIEADSEMAEALREATASLDALRPGQSGAGKGGESGNSPDKMTIEILSKELQDLRTLYEENLDETEKFLRLQAEFENFRRRSLKEKQESFKFGHQNLVKDLLSAVDNLERALEHGNQSAASGGEAEAKGLLDGVELVHREILGAFAKHGVREIEAAGQLFDPAVHEALGQVPSAEVPPNSVLEVLQKGYLIHDRMLRPARVIVSREAGERSAENESA